MTIGDPDPLVGRRVGPCTIEERLAAGGMGVVYRATHRDTAEDVAVKILAPSLAQDPEYVARFFREAGAAGQINHPNVVRVLESGEQDGNHFLVMEFVKGETLEEIMEREGRLSLQRATQVVREIACGLAAAHAQGIIHRDVKPGNIIVTRRGKPHLTDFGLARRTHTRKGLTVEGTFLGTPEYASPEQVEGRKVDFRTDIYSLGITYYQALSAAMPFAGTSPMEIAVKRTREAARPLEHAFPGADKRACAVIARMLQRDATKRYASTKDLILDLEAVLAGRNPPTAMPTPKVEKRPLLSVSGKRRIRSALHWSLMVLGVVLAFASGVLAPRPAEGASLGAWSNQDEEFILRALLAGAALIGGVGAMFIYRRELMMTGRMWGLLGVVILMLLGGLSAGVYLDRPAGEGSPATLINGFAVLGSRAGAPANLLALIGFFVFGACMFSISPRAGFASFVYAKVALVAAFLLIYAFAAAEGGFTKPFSNYFRAPELSIPLSVVAGLGAAIGILLLTAPQSETFSRMVGIFLVAVGFIGLYTFVILLSQPHKEGWARMMAEPFRGIGGEMLHSGALLAAVLAAGIVSQSLVSAGLSRYDRFFAKR